LTHFGRRPVSRLIFECVVGVTADVAAAFEIANVNHETFESQNFREPEAMQSMIAFEQLFKVE
jgi:hypothetical protein